MVAASSVRLMRPAMRQHLGIRLLSLATRRMVIRFPLMQPFLPKWRHHVARLLDFILPRRCLECGDAAHRGPCLCAPCCDSLPRAGLQCLVCATPLAYASICGQCLAKPPPFASVFAPFVYRAPLDQWVRAYKYRAQHYMGPNLARLIAMEWQCRGLPRASALVPVPMHAQRLAKRGFNQSFELARIVGRALGVPVYGNLLQRLRHGPPQAALSGSARIANVRGAFRCKSTAGLAHVVLVDDVMTTGSTVRECARVLRKNGIARVDVWVIARA